MAEYLTDLNSRDEQKLQQLASREISERGFFSDKTRASG